MNIFTRKTTKTEWLFFAFLTAFISIDLILFNQMGYTAGQFFSIVLLAVNIPISVSLNILTLLFSLPFSGVLKLSAGGFSILPFLYVLIIGKLLLLRKIRFTTKSTIAFVIIACQQLLAMLCWNSSLPSAISALLSIFFVCTVMLSKVDLGSDSFLENACLFYSGSIVIETLAAQVLTNVPYFISPEKQASMDRAGRFAAYNIDPNEYVQMLLIALMLLSIYLLTRKFSVCSLLAFGSFILLFLFGIRSYSKSYAVTVALLAVFLAFRFLKMLHNRYGARGLVFALIPMLILGVLAGIYLYREVIVAIFENRSRDDLLTGRGDIWKQYLQGMLIRPDTPLLTGCGANNCVQWLRATGIDGRYVPHNIYIEFILEYGLIALIALMFCWGDILKKIFSDISSESNLVFLAFAISGFGISSNANDCLYLVLIILWLLPRRAKQTAKETK